MGNRFMAVFQVFSALMSIVGSKEGKDVIDKIFDMLEDNFPENPIVLSGCTAGRLFLNVPDDDD